MVHPHWHCCCLAPQRPPAGTLNVTCQRLRSRIIMYNNMPKWDALAPATVHDHKPLLEPAREGEQQLKHHTTCRVASSARLQVFVFPIWHHLVTHSHSLHCTTAYLTIQSRRHSPLQHGVCCQAALQQSRAEHQTAKPPHPLAPAPKHPWQLHLRKLRWLKLQQLQLLDPALSTALCLCGVSSRLIGPAAVNTDY